MVLGCFDVDLLDYKSKENVLRTVYLFALGLGLDVNLIWLVKAYFHKDFMFANKTPGNDPGEKIIQSCIHE